MRLYTSGKMKHRQVLTVVGFFLLLQVNFRMSDTTSIQRHHSTNIYLVNASCNCPVVGERAAIFEEAEIPNILEPGGKIVEFLDQIIYNHPEAPPEVA